MLIDNWKVETTVRGPNLGDRLAAVLGAQRPSGAFPSMVHRAGGVVEVDENSFVTVQCLRALERFEKRQWANARILALDFLEQCHFRSGSFGFWPEHRWPIWAPHFGPDTDDTVLIGDALVRANRMDPASVLELAATVSAARVYRPDRDGPAWIQPGAFGTWIDGPPLVDAAVNANVAGFLAGAGHRGRFGYGSAVDTVSAAVEWAGASWPRLVATAPFYPHPAGFRQAIAAAVARGAAELRAPSRALDHRFGARLTADEQNPVCGSAYGAVRWYAPVLA